MTSAHRAIDPSVFVQQRKEMARQPGQKNTEFARDEQNRLNEQNRLSEKPSSIGR